MNLISPCRPAFAALRHLSSGRLSRDVAENAEFEQVSPTLHTYGSRTRMNFAQHYPPWSEWTLWGMR
jgi:hypothetical protein